MTSRDAARQVLYEVIANERLATVELDRVLTHGSFSPRERAFITELVYGTLRYWHRLQAGLASHCNPCKAGLPAQIALTMGAYQVLFLRTANHAAVTDAVEATRRVARSASGFVNAVLRKLATNGEPPLGKPSEAVMHRASLPPWLYRELERIDAALPDAMLAAAPLFVRVNATRSTREALLSEVADTMGAEPASEPFAVRLTQAGAPASHPAFARGAFTVQDLSAQRAVRLAWGSGATNVLDACAGRGGKSLAMAEWAAAAKQDVQIDAADLSAARLAELDAHAQRLGITSVRPVACDLTDATAPLAAAYDLVVLDAPCTGLGVLRRHPEAKLRLKESDVDRLAATQQALVRALWPRVRPGGRMAYMVCSVAEREGPAVVAGHIAATFDARMVSSELMTPLQHGGDGFYVAIIERVASDGSLAS